MNWRVEYEKQVLKEIREQIANGLLSQEDITLLRKWVEAIEIDGLESVQTKNWNDHPLDAEWKGYRSASFSKSGRVIYRTENGRLIVTVVRVTATHNYRR